MVFEEIREEVSSEMELANQYYKTERLDMSVGEILNLYKEGEIIIDPEFQRLFRWESYQKTRLIESILVGIPIPPIFVVENDDGIWELIDGLQRLSTMFSFMGKLKDKKYNNWELEEGDILKKIKGFSYEELPTKAQIKIKRYICRVEIINDKNDYNIRYDLFERLNTGGSKLTDQEIRNVIYRSDSTNFNEFLREEGTNNLFLDLINISEKKEKQLFADELVLRFCSLYDERKITKVLSKYMDECMKNFVEETKDDLSKINKFKYIFEGVLNLLEPLMDKHIFFSANGKGGFSTSVYDGIMYGLAKNIDKYVGKNPDLIFEKIEELKNNAQFKENSGSQSHNPRRVKARKEISHQIFGNVS